MLKFKYLVVIAIFLFSINYILAPEAHGSFKVDTGGAKIIIDPGKCDEDWSGSTWSQCSNNEQIFICFDKNNCRTDDLKPASCGEKRECDDDGAGDSEGGGGGGSSGGGGSGVDSGNSYSGGGGGGGGSGVSSRLSSKSSGTATISVSNCVENWECEEWSKCSLLGKQTRTCVDSNNCNTENLKPREIRECVLGKFSTKQTTYAGIPFGILGAVIGSSGSSSLLFVFVFIIAILILSSIVVIRRNINAKKIISKNVIDNLINNNQENSL